MNFYKVPFNFDTAHTERGKPSKPVIPLKCPTYVRHFEEILDIDGMLKGEKVRGTFARP